jgi:GntR family transcriptional repressor for pyruvate dehydrogenase complex
MARELMDSIIAQRLQPGDELPSEMQLAELFGVSRPVVREALRHLSALHIVAVANGKRAVVQPLSPGLLGTYFSWAVNVRPSSLIELHELRKGIEGQSAWLAAQRHHQEEAETLQALVSRMSACLEDINNYTELDMRLHLAIAAATHNELLRNVVESIREPMKEVIKRGLLVTADRAELEQVQRSHEEIVELVVHRQPREARHAMERHFDGAVARLLRAGQDNRGAGGESATAQSRPYLS